MPPRTQQRECASSITPETLSTPSRCRPWRGERRTSRQIPLSLPSKQAAGLVVAKNAIARAGKRISNSQDSHYTAANHIILRVRVASVLVCLASSRNLNRQYYGIYVSTEIVNEKQSGERSARARHGLFRKCSVVPTPFG